MHVDINYVGVVVAAVASMVVGGVWYARPVFGTAWAKLAGVKMDGKVTTKDMTLLMAVQFAASLLTAYILAHFVFFVHFFTLDSWMMDAVTTALWGWLGFTATRMLSHDMFEGRRKKLTLLNLAHEAVTLVVMGAVIGWLHP
ncbi:MAG TPA: DUF1761 domain-containing protein [Candidatus Saccharimonadales bacterium]|nr:DUF1761 domain-containing protein [Candidatus Saccharimonadales bacterium]